MESIRQKICNFLINEYKKQKVLTIKVSISHKNMTEQMGIQRPSLSRELIDMRKDGIVDFCKDTIIIKNIKLVEKSLWRRGAKMQLRRVIEKNKEVINRVLRVFKQEKNSKKSAAEIFYEAEERSSNAMIDTLTYAAKNREALKEKYKDYLPKEEQYVK